MAQVSLLVAIAGTVYVWLTILRILAEDWTTLTEGQRAPVGLSIEHACAAVMVTMTAAGAWALIGLAFPAATLTALRGGALDACAGGAGVWVLRSAFGGAPRVGARVRESIRLAPGALRDLLSGGFLDADARPAVDAHVTSSLSSEPYTAVAHR